MDVARVLKGDPYQEFRKEEGLEGLQASARGGALQQHLCQMFL
jgi:hypothetical protein